VSLKSDADRQSSFPETAHTLPLHVNSTSANLQWRPSKIFKQLIIPYNQYPVKVECMDDTLLVTPTSSKVTKEEGQYPVSKTQCPRKV
jgi:hypothetical protein